jgi:hypothetical protein
MSLARMHFYPLFSKFTIWSSIGWVLMDAGLSCVIEMKFYCYIIEQ